MKSHLYKNLIVLLTALSVVGIGFVSVLNAQAAPVGLVAAYAFDEGSGVAVTDASGNSNTGSVSGATWTTSGRYGSALSFNGSSNRVDINDANSLDLTTGMTLEAWVYAASVSGWRTVTLKEVSGGLTYALYASDNASRPGVYINTGGSDLSASGTASLSLNTWTHLAATYDGSTLKLFVNGTQVGSRATSGSIRVSTNPLRIGGNTIWGEYFNGRIDEVRVYNRALSQAEIQTDINTAVIVLPADTSPPTAPANLTATVQSESQINLSWSASTDNVGVTGYQIERCQGAGCSSFSQIATTTTTTYNNTGLLASTSYSYRVRATDAANNLSGYSNIASAATLDTTAPTAPTGLTATAESESQINLAWTASTDNVGVTGYQLERCQGAGCSTFTQIATTTTTTYNNTSLLAGTSYSYRVRATDAANNLSVYSNIASATTQQLSDTSPPTAPANLTATAASSSQVNLAWTASTDNVGVTGYQLERCQGAGCSTFSQIATTTTTTYNNTSLLAGTSYSYRVRATDAANNLSPYSNTAGTATPDTPTLSAIAVTPANQTITNGATQQFTATGTYSDGSTQNITSQATWSSSNTSVATINSAGLATAVSAGSTSISATLSGVTGNTNLTVQATLLTITTTSLSNGTLSVSYSATLAASGGTPPYTWSTSSGSLPTGLSINSGTGVISGTPTATGAYSFTVQVTDTSNPNQTTTRALSITVVAQTNSTIWPGTTVPGVVDSGPDSSVELGVKFRSDSSGNITGIRFYKASANTGTHVGNLWTSTGTLLATAIFTNETASGWQQVLFSSPVAITANTVYVASYHTSAGHYSDDLGYFSGKGMDSPPLHALTDGVSGFNGVYAYGSTSSFPNQGWQSSNYWVDVVFSTTGSPPPTLSAIAVTPSNQTISTGATQQFTATGTYSDGSTQNITSQATWSSSNTSVATINSAGLATAVSAGSTSISATLSGVTGNTNLTVQATPLTITTTSLSNGTLDVSYSATLAASGGTPPYTWSTSSGSLPTGLSINSGTGVISGTPTATGAYSFTVQVTDTSNPNQTTTRALSITVAAQTNSTIWPGTTVPGVVDSGPDSSVELGVKFRSDSSGNITGVRFYKATTNTGTHVANLWTSTGTKLATATFTGETASGWQQVNFSPPVAITANTVYVASYHTNTGHYSADQNYFATTGVDSPPLHALANGVSGGNGVYAYGSTSSFPNQTWNTANYWVDVVFSATPPATLSAIAVTPANQTITNGATQQFTATGTYSDGSTQNITSQATWSSSNTSVATINSAGLATAVSAGSTSISATLSGVTGNTNLTVQATPLTITTTSLSNGTLDVSYSATLAASGGTPPYTWSTSSGSLPTGLSINSGTGVISGTPTATGAYSFTVQVTDTSNPNQTTTKALSIVVAAAPVTQTPILIISSGSNPFSNYYAEILRTEGLNEFDVRDISTVSSADLSSYDVVILGQISLSSAQATMFSTWVNGGGKLIAMRPDKKLAGLLGLSDLLSTNSDRYLLVNTSSGPGVGIVNETIQYHGTADLYSLNGASSLAILYSNATTATSSPAVTLNNVGMTGGQAAAFTYDLARSVVYTRQGNPFWAGQIRDGISPIRPDDLFYGNASFDPQPDWIDLGKVAIPQADEQQRLLANLIIGMNSNKKPLPRFWYLPRSLEAAVVMTGDDHGALYGGGATAARFDQFLAASPQGCMVDNWECVRGTSYLIAPSVAGNPLTNAQAAAYINSGFEISVHVDTSPDCTDWTPASLAAAYTGNLNSFASTYTSVPAPDTHRMHCISWSDYDSQPKTEFAHGIRLDTNYYYWPSAWINNRPGMFTGSGMPMRFTDSDGNLIDVYQATTQMTDESGQAYPYTINTLLDRAIGPEGYYGVFTANIHTDSAGSVESDAIVQSAIARGIPVVSARQMLQWLDGRNASRFSSLSWSGSTLSFSISVGQGANGLVAMTPVPNGQTVTSITFNGSPITFTMSTVKGIQYALFWAENGAYQVTYALETTPPTIWSDATTPLIVAQADSNAIEVGVKFRSDVSGHIVGLRFYKSSTNTGTHVGNLWTSSGTLLATVTFTNETASGWQQTALPAPVPITANTTYVASYHTDMGHYSADPAYFAASGFYSPPLQALANGLDGPNGVYQYGASGFPTQTFNSTNYWVDVVFQP